MGEPERKITPEDLSSRIRSPVFDGVDPVVCIYIYILYILCSGKSDGQVTTYSILLLIVSRGNIVNRTKYC